MATGLELLAIFTRPNDPSFHPLLVPMHVVRSHFSPRQSNQRESLPYSLLGYWATAQQLVEKKIVIQNSFSQVINHINTNGGWGVIGWYKQRVSTGSSALTSTMATQTSLLNNKSLPKHLNFKSVIFTHLTMTSLLHVYYKTAFLLTKNTHYTTCSAFVLCIANRCRCITEKPFLFIGQTILSR
jgi:hypothetical protein